MRVGRHPSPLPWRQPFVSRLQKAEIKTDGLQIMV
jgi:hypothetical protein